MVQKNRVGFTLVEMMVVISIIGILMAIALPAISAARESARNSACGNNLRQFGVGLQAVANRIGTYGSGAMDWARDGAVTDHGWVADMVAQGALPGEMLCRSNPNQLSVAYQDLLQGNFSAPDPCRPNILGSEPHTLPDGTVVRNPCRQIIEDGILPGATRNQLVETLILNKGYNTNYTASWYMVRSEPKLNKNGNLEAISGCTLVGIKERTCTTGPLSMARLDSSGVPISHVPLLADGGSEGILTEAIGSFYSGTGYAASFTAGPVQNATMAAPPANPDPTPYEGPNGWWAIWSKTTRQDFRKFGPVHGGSYGTCNILFADGSVRPFRDDNGDGYLNNGFDPALAGAGTKVGYSSSKIELPATDIQSGWAIRN